MPCHVLCPGCGNGLSEVYDFINITKQGYYKSLGVNIANMNVNKLEICPNLTKPIGFILDAAGLNLICCRMHILGVTNFDSIYK
jgi:DNA-directed RNA polymerase subunit N (RpoN/RPB10)